MKLSNAALSLVLLATVAAPCQATSVTLSPAATCSLTDGTGTCSVAQDGAVGFNSALNWIAVSSGTLNSAVVGSSTKIDLSVSGTASGSFPSVESVPASFDFILDNIGGTGSISWSIGFGLPGATGLAGVDTVAGIDEITGTLSVLGPPISISGYTITLNTSDSSSDAYTLSIPSATGLQFNPVVAAAAPEPSTIFLSLGTGVALLAFRPRRRQSNR